MSESRLVSGGSQAVPNHVRAERVARCLLAILLLVSMGGIPAAEEVGRGGVYSVVELTFHGPAQGPADAPARDVDFRVRFRHEDGRDEHKVHGFWDGDGRGGTLGRCLQGPLLPDAGRAAGCWPRCTPAPRELAGQHQGDFVTATPSDRHGFWVVDPDESRPPLVQAVGRLAPVHHRQHPLQLPVGLPGRRAAQRQRHRPGRRPQRRVLQEAPLRPPGRPLPEPDGQAVPGRPGATHRRRRLLAPPQPGLVPRPGRRGGAHGLRPRPDRRPDPLRPRHRGRPARPCGRAATAATRRRT